MQHKDKPHRIELRHGEVTRRILATFFEVYNELGTGFVETVYRASLARAMRDRGLEVIVEWPIDVYFRGDIVGRFQADLVIENQVIVELKAVRALLPEHQAQLINYLRATPMEVGILVNFGRSPEFKRFIYSNGRKKALFQR